MIFNLFRNWRRKNVVAASLTNKQKGLLEEKFQFYSRLSKEKQSRLVDLVSIFLSEKKFVGCGGLEITEEIRISIAAYASLLHLGFDHQNLYPDLNTIYVYPHPYKAKVKSIVAGNFVVESEEIRAGESWHKSFVVLSWDTVQRGSQDIRDGHNVVLHEFAHQLDQESGGMDGTPDLKTLRKYAAWGRTLSPIFLNLQEEVKKHHPTLIDSYGATNEAEFFAVLTETFFEKPHQLKKKYKMAYEILRDFYGQDPVSYFSEK